MLASTLQTLGPRTATIGAESAKARYLHNRLHETCLFWSVLVLIYGINIEIGQSILAVYWHMFWNCAVENCDGKFYKLAKKCYTCEVGMYAALLFAWNPILYMAVVCKWICCLEYEYVLLRWIFGRSVSCVSVGIIDTRCV